MRWGVRDAFGGCCCRLGGWVWASWLCAGLLKTVGGWACRLSDLSRGKGNQCNEMGVWQRECGGVGKECMREGEREGKRVWPAVGWVGEGLACWWMDGLMVMEVR